MIVHIDHDYIKEIGCPSEFFSIGTDRALNRSKPGHDYLHLIEVLKKLTPYTLYLSTYTYTCNTCICMNQYIHCQWST